MTYGAHAYGSTTYGGRIRARAIKIISKGVSVLLSLGQKSSILTTKKNNAVIIKSKNTTISL